MGVEEGERLRSEAAPKTVKAVKKSTASAEKRTTSPKKAAAKGRKAASPHGSAAYYGARVAGGGWEQGWIVFHDSNNDGARQAGEEIVWRAQAMPGSVRVLGNINVSKYVSYSPTGEAKLASGGFQAGTITVCDTSSSNQVGREIVISSSGRPRVQKLQLASCV